MMVPKANRLATYKYLFEGEPGHRNTPLISQHLIAKMLSF